MKFHFVNVRLVQVMKYYFDKYHVCFIVWKIQILAHLSNFYERDQSKLKKIESESTIFPKKIKIFPTNEKLLNRTSNNNFHIVQ